MQGFLQRRENRHARVERGVGVLKDHLKIESAAADLILTELCERLAIENDLARSGGDELHDRAGKSRLAATRFADEAEDLAFFDRQRNIIDRPDEIFFAGKKRA